MKYLFILLLISSTVFAGGNTLETNSYYDIHKSFLSMNCINEATHKEMDECGAISLEKAKIKMKNILVLLVTTSPKGALISSDLELSQLHWTKYINASCNIETYDSKDGSGYYSIFNYCLETKINERISYLTWLSDAP